MAINYSMSRPSKNICIVLSSPVKYSETFIKTHIEHLQAKVFYSRNLPYCYRYVSESDTEKQASAPKSIYYFLSDWIKLRKFKRFVAKHKIDVVLAEYGMNGVRALKTCKELSMPLIVHYHGFDAYKKKILDEYQAGYTELFGYASAIITVSKDMQQQLMALGAPASKVFYNVYGVDTQQFEVSNVLQSPKQLIAVGRFVDKKAPYLTILAFQKVLERVPDARLVMVGSGELLDTCTRIVQALKLGDHISLPGKVAHKEVAALMRSSRAFVQHSLVPLSGDSEGTPNAILEAQACALPVISTKHAGIKDVVIQHETGYLVEEGDIEEMAVYMIQVLEDAELALRIGQNGRKHIAENYSVEKSINGLLKIVEDHVN